jgi:tetratricopeptide (TPR) repeat protein
MKIIIKITTLLFLLATSRVTFSQSNEDKANEKKDQAIKLEDDGKVDDAIKLLLEACKLCPDQFMFPYELGYAYYVKEDFKKSIKYLQDALKLKNPSDLGYQLLGNCYDRQGNSDKAIETYKDGLKIFPNSGKLYLEQGNVFWGKKDYNKALPYYERGIQIDPQFPSNYYRATILYLSTTEKVWGMIYGEIFMNLERNSKRTKEISKMLYDTYKSSILFTSDTSASVSFSKFASIDINDLKDTAKFKLPFGVGVYEPCILFSILAQKEISLTSLNTIRADFLKNYFDKEFNKTYPNILFNYQKKISDAGHLEAYNHWILMKGDEDNFTKWQESNKSKWDDFIKWFKDNKIIVDKDNMFYREQY